MEAPITAPFNAGRAAMFYRQVQKRQKIKRYHQQKIALQHRHTEVIRRGVIGPGGEVAEYAGTQTVSGSIPHAQGPEVEGLQKQERCY